MMLTQTRRQPMVNVTGNGIYQDHGENTARPWVGIDLRDARTRTATGNLTNAMTSST